MKRSTLFTILSFLIVFIAGVIAAYTFLKPEKKLKIYQASDINPELLDSESKQNSVSHSIADFELTNQMGEKVSQKTTAGKIYVADFFFTTCGSICPKMTKQMQRVYEAYQDNSQILLLSHTVMPEVDSVPVLNAYAQKMGIKDAQQWHFLTGNKKDIYHLARKSYFAVLTEGNGDANDFIHTENFILVDTKKRIRGFYDGTNTQEVDQLIEDIAVLMKEKN